MSELAPVNPDVTLRGVYILWRKAEGPLPPALQAADGASTSTTYVRSPVATPSPRR